MPAPVRLEHSPDEGPPRVFIVSSRRIEHTRLVVLTFEDVTDEERTKQQLRRSEGELREVLTTAAEGVVMSDATDCIIFANRTAREIFGYDDRELIGESLLTLVPQRLRAELAGYLRSPAAQQLGGSREVVGLRKDGSEVHVELTFSAFARERGRLMVCFIVDISARRESERRIADYQERLRQMAFDAALTEERERRRIAIDLHDRIGQALALAQMKLTAAPEASAPGPLKEAIALIAQAVLDTRTLTFELSPPLLYELGLKEARSWLAEDLSQSSGIRIELADDGTSKPLDDASAALAFRAVRELLANVLKHSSSPVAKISLCRDGGELEVTVEDQGVGFQPPAAGRSRAVGFGLLSVREQISGLGGSVHVESEVGLGTRVTLRLPIKLDTPLRLDEPPGASDSPASGALAVSP
jgi:PAS domain S-box-containing protein